MSTSHRIAPAPAVLRLVQAVVLGRWRASGEDLYREVVRMADIRPGQEVLVSGCGEGVTSAWIANRTGAHVTGVDSDVDQVERAAERARALATPQSLTYEHAPLDDLPHEDAVFDSAVGEPVLAAAAAPGRAVAELVRVTKPLGSVCLLQLTWRSEATSEARELLAERLGLRPHLLVEWKQMLREAGVVEIQVQDWTSGTPSGSPAGTPAGAPTRTSGAYRAIGEAPQLTWQVKAQIVGRAWRRWGWREAREAVERETALLRDLSREGALGFQLIKGVKWPHAKGS